MVERNIRPTSTLDTSKIATPAFVIEDDLLKHNLSILRDIKNATGCKMYQALKTWSTWQLFPTTREYLDGTEVSSPNEARLGYEEFNHEVHMYAPAYKEAEFDDVMRYSSTIIFNSFAQWKKFKPRILAFEQHSGRKIECGLRINPEYLPHDDHGGLWSPGAPGSRLGIRLHEFQAALTLDREILEGISGFHFHMFWDRTFTELSEAIEVIEKKFGEYFGTMKWINFGGGQMITNDDYDAGGLINLINTFQKKHGVVVHLEPGAAIIKDAGFLVSTVLDIVERDDVPYKIAILDISFNAHTPDFLLHPDLDMPIVGAEIVRDENKNSQHQNLYRFAGGTCVTGDQLHQLHSFKKPLAVGDVIIMKDAVQYNLVQCTMFNGVQHPSVVLWKERAPRTLRAFTYEDYKARMG